MKKGLIGIMVLACVALIFGTALANQTFWSIDVSGSVEWTILNQDGLMPGVDGAGPALVIPELTITAGPWEAGTGAGTTAPGGDVDVASGSGYIKYTKANIGSITLNNEVSYDIFGLGANITAAQGITLATEVVPLSLNAVYTTNSEYGLGATYDVGVATLGAAYNSTGAWAGQLVTSTDLMTITLTSGVNGAAQNAYGVGLAAGVISLGYDVTFDSVTTEAVDAVWEDVAGVWTKTTDYVAEVLGGPVAKLTAEVADIPLTESTKLTIEVVNQDIADINYAAGTTITATTVTALADAIDLTTVIASKPVTGIEYSSKIGVTF